MSDGGREKGKKQGMEGEGLDRKATAQRMVLMRKKEEEQRNRLFEFHLKNLMDMLNVHTGRMRNGSMHVCREDLEVMTSAFVNMVDMHPVFGVEARKEKIMKRKREMEVKKWDSGMGGRRSTGVTMRDHALQQKQKQDLEYAKQAIRDMAVLGGKQQQGGKNGMVVDQGSFDSCKTTGMNTANTNVQVGWQQLLLPLQQQYHHQHQQQHQQQQQQQQQNQSHQQQNQQQGFALYDRAGLDMNMGMMMKKTGRNDDHLDHQQQRPVGGAQHQYVQGEEQTGIRASDHSAMMFKQLQRELLESLQAGKSVGNGDYDNRDKSTNEKELMHLICRALNPAGGLDNSHIHTQDGMQKIGKRAFDDDKDAANVLMSLGSAPLEKRAKSMETAGFRPVQSSSAHLAATVNSVSNNINSKEGPSNHVDSQEANRMMDGKEVLSDLYSLLARVAGDNTTRPSSR